MPELLQHWVTEQAGRRPEAPAIVWQGARVTYGELEGFSNRLARLLRDGGCRRGDRVAALMPKSPTAIAALLGVYKADGIYVPLDPSSPAGRLTRILDSCENRWLLAGGPVRPVLEQLGLEAGRRQLISLGWLESRPLAGTRFRPGFTLDDVAGYSAEPVAARNTAEDPAHILFTSGSTGTPKGVVITHANVIHFVQWATRYFGMNPSDRVSAHSPLYWMTRLPHVRFTNLYGPTETTIASSYYSARSRSPAGRPGSGF